MGQQSEYQVSHICSLQVMANRLRRHSLISTAVAGSGHPSSCLSAAELVSTLFFSFLRFDVSDPDNPLNDRFILSKGHAAPLLWAVWAEAGAFPVEKLSTLRQFDSDLEGHPTPRNPWVDIATGSLGQGLSAGVGMALVSKMDRIKNHIYVLLGDGEVAEGSVWEAAALAAHRKLNNLIAIVDVNRLGQSQETMFGHDVESYRHRFQAFGWRSEVIDGHDIEQLLNVFNRALRVRNRPFAIIARTVKGKGVSFMEDRNGWHGKPVKQGEELERALAEVGNSEPVTRLTMSHPPSRPAGIAKAGKSVSDPEYAPGQEIATREAYGFSLTKQGAVNPRVVVLDGDTKNSTFSEKFAQAYPERFIECFIAEQNMIGAAAGISALGKIPFASTFACFLTRAFDHLRMAAISQANIKVCGSHAGVSIGEDGPSQMGLEDLSMMRAVAGSTVLYPCDGVSAERLVALAADTPGIVYIRTSRPKTPVIYTAADQFRIGGSQVLRRSGQDVATVVAAGVTLHEALTAYEALKREGISVRVIDLYSIKPLDSETLQQAAVETGRVITVEDHFPEGGLGEAVLTALRNLPCRFKRLAVYGTPRSGSPKQLLHAFEIDAQAIIQAVKEISGD
ncbi:MAG: transketolase [Acidobacteria bacterium]|nr:transketolase [Acidobacteriota bacterium]